jgi:hypothetical protein
MTRSAGRAEVVAVAVKPGDSKEHRERLRPAVEGEDTVVRDGEARLRERGSQPDVLGDGQRISRHLEAVQVERKRGQIALMQEEKIALRGVERIGLAAQESLRFVRLERADVDTTFFVVSAAGEKEEPLAVRQEVRVWVGCLLKRVELRHGSR